MITPSTAVDSASFANAATGSDGEDPKCMSLPDLKATLKAGARHDRAISANY